MTAVSTEQCDKRHDSLKWWLRVVFGLIGAGLGFTLSYAIGAYGAAQATGSKIEAQANQLQEIQTNIREIRQMQMKILRNHAGGE
jgi:outer membrane lipoprotein SlyB